MGGNEMDKISKDEVKASSIPSTQEQSSTASHGTVNPEWPGFQTFPHIPPHGFMASSPQAHPYMWGVQHIMPAYGTPPHPYVAMYPHSGIYAHPSIPPGSYPFSPFTMPSTNGVMEASGNTPGMESESRPSDLKEKLPIKRSKESLGSLNMISWKNNEAGKTGTSTNGGYSKSIESGSEGSSDGSDANSQNGSQLKPCERRDSLEGSDSQNENSVIHGGPNGVQGGTPSSATSQAASIMPMSATNISGAIPAPTTNLNIGMDYWGSPSAAPIPVVHGKLSAPVSAGVVSAGTRDSTVHSQLWLQDERELKRQRRKQSNRESARRSRLRKQAECDELAQRAESLKEENTTLRAEINRIKNEYDLLRKENANLKERLVEQSGDGEFNSGGTDQFSSQEQDAEQSAG